MTKARLYPGADRSQWKGDRPTMPDIDMLLLHTTESSWWPSYPNFAPNLTFNPWEARGKRWRQHYFVNDAATTLKNAGDYQTNRANVCQIEIVAWVDPNHSDARSYYTKISDDAYHELGEFFAWLHNEWGTALELYPRWKRYPDSYGYDNGIRMSTAQFTAFKGLCGHMHAPGNSHGDPSLIKVGFITDTAKQIVEEDMALSDEDIAKIAKAVWTHASVDLFKPPPGKETPENPTWKAHSEINWLVENVDAIRKKLG